MNLLESIPSLIQILSQKATNNLQSFQWVIFLVVMVPTNILTITWLN